MGAIEAIISGVIQGVTEFFPVSSSGHLAVLHAFFGVEGPTILFDVVLHAGTLLAILVYFRKEITSILTKEKGALLPIAVGTVPAVIAALFFGDAIEGCFKNVRFVAAMLVVTGAWLLLGHIVSGMWQKRSLASERPGAFRALLIGLAQAVALLPGISRSGSTISSAMILGVKREEAFRFSFLLSIPAVCGALVYKMKDFSMIGTERDLLYYAAGGFVAFLVGLVTLKALYLFVRNQRLYYFSVYCACVGLLLLILT